MRVKLRDAHDIATSFRQRLIDQRSPTLPLIGNSKLVILITAELSSTAFHHTYKIQMRMATPAPTFLVRTTYVIMATKTGPHAVSTILPIA